MLSSASSGAAPPVCASAQAGPPELLLLCDGEACAAYLAVVALTERLPHRDSEAPNRLQGSMRVAPEVGSSTDPLRTALISQKTYATTDEPSFRHVYYTPTGLFAMVSGKAFRRC